MGRFLIVIFSIFLVVVVFLLFNEGSNVVNLQAELSTLDECSEVRSELPAGTVLKEIEFREAGEAWKVAYYVLNGVAKKRPLVFINGGPGQSALGSIEYFLEKAIFRDRPIIFFDQRGTGCSTPYPDNLVASEKFSSLSISRDITRILVAENVEKAHFLAHSFGGRVLYFFARNTPELVISSHTIGFHPSNRDRYVKQSCLNFKSSLDQFLDSNYFNKAFFRKLERKLGNRCYKGNYTTYCGLYFDGILLLDVIEYGSPRVKEILAKDMRDLQTGFVDKKWRSFLKKWIFFDEKGDYWVGLVAGLEGGYLDPCKICSDIDMSYPNSLFSSCHFLDRVREPGSVLNVKQSPNLVIGKAAYFEVIGARKNYFYFSRRDPIFPESFLDSVVPSNLIKETFVGHSDYLDSVEVADFFKTAD